MKITLELNAYQAANLLWFLKRAWYQAALNPILCPNNGDWTGEIPQALEVKMKEAGGEFLTHRANGYRDPFVVPNWDGKQYIWPDT